jgi:hypothetical protein
VTRTLLLVGMFVSPLSSQAIHAGENVPVAIGLNDRPIGEPHLAVHPANPKHLLGAAMVSVVAPNFRMRMQQQTCATFVSVDGGRNGR